MSSPATSWLACTPDCFTPIQPERCACGTAVTTSRLVVGFEIDWAGPAMITEAKSTQKFCASAAMTSARTVPPKIRTICWRLVARSLNRPSHALPTAALANTAPARSPNCDWVMPKSWRMSGLTALRP